MNRYLLIIDKGEYELGLRYTPADRILSLVEYAGPMRIVVNAGETSEAAFRVPLPIYPQDGSPWVEVTEEHIRVAWQEVPEADSYLITFWKLYPTRSGTGTTASHIHFARTDRIEYVLDLSAFRWATGGPYPIYEDGGRPPSFILGEYGGEYRIHVEAYRDGEVIATSKVIDHERFEGEVFVITDAFEWSDEEQLIVDGRFDEAIERFERRLQENPNDLVAALALYRMYQFGTNEWTKAHQDYRKGA